MRAQIQDRRHLDGDLPARFDGLAIRNPAVLIGGPAESKFKYERE